MPTKRKHMQPRKRNNGGSIITAIKLAPALLKALAKRLAIKGAKKAALPGAVGVAAYTKGRMHKRPITVRY